MTLTQYIDKINTLYKTGNAREHSYRGDLQNLLMHLLPDVLVTNEPARVDCGAPDYVLTRKDVPIGYIEAKDIGVDLGSKTLKEQFDRYKSGLSNLIFTDYMDFHFYKDGEFITKIAIAKLTTPPNGHPSKGGEVKTEIVPITENFEQFTNLIQNFAVTVSQTIKSPTKLAQMMAGKARLMADVIEKSLNNDDLEGKRSQIKSQMLAFQQMLIHDIDNKSFSDIYAQTIAYGMFAARYHDPTLPTFSREEAATLIPKSNPFLRKLFQDIAGYDLDNRLAWIVDELVNIFLASDVALIMKNFGKSTKQEDPVVHFYETFLGEYNPSLRKARGVWYTPQPVVNFIVRAVDDILKTEFNLPQGLADTSKIKIKKKAVTKATADKRSKLTEVETEQEVHKVQILDPATGTGTFLAEVVKHIYKKFEGQQGIWSKYVANDLIPRLNGFELLMASYAMAHLKMDMLLTETGYKPTTPPDGHPSKGGESQRLKIFLTNSLEEAHPDTQTLFSSWLSDEADQANAIKRDAPVMVVMGNPPYSGESANKGEWIMNLMEDYKKEPGGKEKLKERNPKWINDDYVKFMRFGQHFIDKNGSGILAFINPHGFLDNPTFRGMRWNLLKTYDKIYTIDLHGNGKKKETAPDGSVDQNVFDIMQGVSINLFVKTGKKKENDLADVFHYDLFGKRELKYDFINNNNLKSIAFETVNSSSPNYFFVKTDEETLNFYQKGFSVNEFFNKNSSGIATARDSFTIKNSIEEIKEVINDFILLDDEIARVKYNLREDVRDWKVSLAKEDVLKNYKDDSKYVKILYRPFDIKYTFYTGKSKGFHCMPRGEIMNNFFNKDNIGYIFPRQCKGESGFNHGFISKNIIDVASGDAHSGSGTNFFPLYLYPEKTTQQSLLDEVVRTPNLNMEIVNQMAEQLGIPFVTEKDLTSFENLSGLPKDFAPIDILDYIYAILHSPNYREKYKEFLKIDFPRVPYPKDRATFWQLVELGSELRQIHLLESDVVEKYITKYPEDGDNVVMKPRFENSPPLEGNLGRVYINETQYFANVPEVAWNFYIGGYQPAQKWLKDRKDRELSTDDIFHYQKIIVALTETDRIMKLIDTIQL
ncbi:type ISP restriction/modification enzyme [Flavobacterium celericrescens]|uniref:site-specific DNA-methyltransferase (adenine-specific) n=1 Tax=Flavobacterium celericrescens TaxID=2709780 RepID=A0ABX0IIV5_9FLAO|nr:type ISP restriction/modification enzyme [Flavobacterium celericrescens]NHM05532.1 DNA methyltransferase [Flavobacterium celericrescens]